MAGYFFDSSALAKRYHVELGTARVDQVFRTPGNAIRISRLTVVELTAVFGIKVRTHAVTKEDALLLLRQFRGDIASGDFEIFPIGEPEFTLAEDLIIRYALDHRLRTLDAVQIAVSLRLRSMSLIDYFVSADKVLCEIAAIEGFSILNPESP